MIACCLGRRSYLWCTETISGPYANHTLIPARLANQYTQICFACNIKVLSGFIGLRARTHTKRTIVPLQAPKECGRGMCLMSLIINHVITWS